MSPIIWQPASEPEPRTLPLFTALARGITGRCPACGEGHAFNGFLRVVRNCRACGAPLGTARADDAPPYFTILIVGHLVVPPMVLWERNGNPSDWLVAAVFVPLTAALAVGLLRPVKGAVLGVLVAFNMLKQPDQPA